MTAPISLFEVSPALDLQAAAWQFAAQGHVQIRDVLTAPAAETIRDVMTRLTPWGLVWQAGEDGPNQLRRAEIGQVHPERQQRISAQLAAAMQSRDFAFNYSSYPMLRAYQEKWAPDGPHDLLLEHLNDAPFLDLARTVSGLPQLRKADAQATLYQPGQFLSEHDDSRVAEGRRIAYVLNFCTADWRPDWGGYLQFYDGEGDIERGYKPRFNALNLFAVPRKHSVSFVPPFAPLARFAITGWFRDV